VTIKRGLSIGRSHSLSRAARHLALAAALAVWPSALCLANDATGAQWWDTTGFKVDINSDWSTTAEEEFRVDGDSGLYYHHWDIGLGYAGLAEWIDVSLNFRQVYDKDDDGEWRQENQPHVNVTFADTFAGIACSTRSRFEYRDRVGGEDNWRYRNKVTFGLPWELTPLKVKPYVADEVFINMDGSGYSQNRFYAGGVLSLAKNVKLDLYYLWQSTRADPGRDNIHAIGTKLVFLF